MVEMLGIMVDIVMLPFNAIMATELSIGWKIVLVAAIYLGHHNK